MEKEPLKKFVNKIKNYHYQKELYEKELQCACYLYRFFKEQNNENYQVFKRLYNTLPRDSKSKAISYYIIYVNKEREKQLKLEIKNNKNRKVK